MKISFLISIWCINFSWFRVRIYTSQAIFLTRMENVFFLCSELIKNLFSWLKRNGEWNNRKKWKDVVDFSVFTNIFAFIAGRFDDYAIPTSFLMAKMLWGFEAPILFHQKLQSKMKKRYKTLFQQNRCRPPPQNYFSRNFALIPRIVIAFKLRVLFKSVKKRSVDSSSVCRRFVSCNGQKNLKEIKWK